MPESGKLPTVAVLGGTGKEGRGLAIRWAHYGYPVIIGSRSTDKAETAAEEINALLERNTAQGLQNEGAARAAEVVVITVPYSAHRATLESVREAVQGKVLVDVTVPLKPPQVDIVHLPKGRTAAEEAQALLGEGVRVVSAFQNVSATHLKDLDHPIECDVLVSGDDEAAKQIVYPLVEAAGMRPVDAGVLANAIVAESLTPLLVHINKTHKVRGTGIRITGLGD